MSVSELNSAWHELAGVLGIPDEAIKEIDPFSSPSEGSTAIVQNMTTVFRALLARIV